MRWYLARQVNNIQILSLTSQLSPVMDIYAHVTGSKKGTHYAKVPVTFNTSKTEDTILSGTFFLHQQDLTSLIIVCAFPSSPSFIILLPLVGSKHNFWISALLYLMIFSPLFPRAELTWFLRSICPSQFF